MSAGRPRGVPYSLRNGLEDALAVNTRMRLVLAQTLTLAQAVLRGEGGGGGAPPSQRAKILACRFDSAVPLSRQQIVQLTGIPLNAVCGRVNQLLGREKVAEKQRGPLLRGADEEKD